MADQLNDRPVFTILMGCNGAGKTSWKRRHHDQLPDHHFDLDAVAGGIGDWNRQGAQRRALELVNEEISRLIEARADFGTETTYAGRRGPSMVQQMLERGYRVEGLYIGTETPDINVERVAYRARTYTGHHIDVDRIRERWARSLSHLRNDAPKFDQLVMIDNSVHDEARQPRPRKQCTLERGRIQHDDLDATWCREWLEKLSQST